MANDHKFRQIDLFADNSLNRTYAIKRSLRIALSNTSKSRDEIVDEMNAIAVREGMRQKTSKPSLDGWTKDSAPDRLPSPAWLVIFCHVLDDTDPIAAMVAPLGKIVVGEREKALIAWAEAEAQKRRAAKRARIALEQLEDIS